MTIHFGPDAINELLKKHLRNVYPDKIIGEPRQVIGNGYDVTILDQSPFDLPPEKVKAGFDRARDAINKLP